jgi:hypothetical protein
MSTPDQKQVTADAAAAAAAAAADAVNDQKQVTAADIVVGKKSGELACVGKRDELDLLVDREVRRCLDEKDEHPFLRHIDYFRDPATGKIDAQSIAKLWTQLTKQSTFKSNIKASITIDGANQMALFRKGLAKHGPGCPYRSTFATSAELMPNLKHPCDTGIVNIDGSINADRLKQVLQLVAEWDPVVNMWLVRESKMQGLLVVRKKEDAHLGPKVTGIAGLLADWPTVARNEWYDDFEVYCDLWLPLHNNPKELERTISLPRFLQFYYQCDKLNTDVLRGILPAKKPEPTNPPSTPCHIM